MSAGGFTTKDPIGFGGGYNMYGYVQNNPMKYTDPMGLYPYALLVQDDDPSLAGMAYGVVTMAGRRWFGSTPRLYRFSEFSNFNDFWRNVYSESAWLPVSRMIMLAHGLEYRGYIQYSSKAGSSSLSGFLGATAFRNAALCINPNAMFASNAEMFFVSCFTALTPIPSQFAATYDFAAKGATVYASRLSIAYRMWNPKIARSYPWYVRYP